MAAISLPAASGLAPARLPTLGAGHVSSSRSLPAPAPSRSRGVGATRRATSLAGRAAVDDALGPMGHGRVKEVQSRADWEAALSLAVDRLVVLDIATRTCGPCKLIYPKVVKMSLEYEHVDFYKIYGDLNEETRGLMREWGVRAVPAFRFFKAGKEIHKHSGAKEEDLRKSIEKCLAQSAVA